jgi:hypothetical protein
MESDEREDLALLSTHKLIEAHITFKKPFDESVIRGCVAEILKGLYPSCPYTLNLTTNSQMHHPLSNGWTGCS